MAVSEAIAQACAEGARLMPACAALGLSERTLQRWRQAGAVKGDGRRRERRAAQAVRTPANRLSPAEQAEILTVANQPEFAHLSPHQIVPALADQGRYIASESTFYRVLRAADPRPRRGYVRNPSRPPVPMRCGVGISPIWRAPCAGPSSIST
jgi:putative transposase